MAVKKLYECLASGFFMGEWVEKGARLPLFPEQVKYDMHRFSEVETETPTPPAVERPRRTGRRTSP